MNKYECEIILDSIVQEERITCFRVTYPRIVHSEFLRHRMASYCLSGDNDLYFIQPNGVLKKYNLKDFHDKWHYGVLNSSYKKRQKWSESLSQIDINKYYIPKELKNIGFRNIQNLYVSSNLKSVGFKEERRILGKDIHDWVNGVSSYMQPIKDRLKKMNLRCYDFDSQEFTTTHIKDIWISGKKDIFEVVLKDGKSIKITSDHPLYFKDFGWSNIKDVFDIQLKDTRVIRKNVKVEIATNGEKDLYKNKDWLILQKNTGKTITEIAKDLAISRKKVEAFTYKYRISFSKKVNILNENLQYKDKNYLQKMKDDGYSNGAIAKLCNTTEDRIKKQIKKYKIKTLSRIVKTLRPIPWNKGKTYTHSENTKLKLKNIKRRKNIEILNKRQFSDKELRDRIDFLNLIRKRKLEEYNFQCAITGLKGKLELHHIDPCWNNKKLMFNEDNIIVLHKNFHRYLHNNNLELKLLDWINKGNSPKDFLTLNLEKINYKEIFKPTKSKRKTIKYLEIIDIKYLGEEVVYDLEVEHKDHNFVANGIVLHNCSASSRAIPLNRIIEQYFGYIPDNWRKHQSGMQPIEGSNIFTEEEVKEFEEIYKSIMGFSELKARLLHKEGKGLAKEQVNRLLEPYSYITHLVQTTRKGYEHFFDLRTHNTAQYEIRVIAEMMKEQYNKSNPVKRKYHLPFYQNEFLEDTTPDILKYLKVSSARCARTSYYNHEGNTPSLEEDLKLSENLLTDKHLSPFEFPVIDRLKAEEKFSELKWWEFVEEERWWKKIELKEGLPITIRRDLSGNLNNWRVVQFRKILEIMNL